MPVPEPFHELLSRLLEERGLSKSAFARDVGISYSQVIRVTLGARTPPLEALPAWVDALGLKGTERGRFILAGQFAHAPEAVREHLARVEAELDRLKNRK